MTQKKELVKAGAPAVQLGTVAARTPADLVAAARAAADVLAGVVREKGLAARIQGKEFVKCEGWTTLAAMLGVVPREEVVHATPDGKRYVATVSLVRIADGQKISEASAECGSDEPRWARMPRYARRSMAITRATSKACRLAFSWVMTLAGYEATPAEEVVDISTQEVTVSAPAPAPATAHGAGERTISKAQAKRLWAICYSTAEELGIDREKVEGVVREILEGHGFKTTTDIPRADYEEFVNIATAAVRSLSDETIAEFEDSAGEGAPF